MPEYNDVQSPKAFMDSEALREVNNVGQDKQEVELPKPSLNDEKIYQRFLEHKSLSEGTFSSIYSQMEDDWKVYLLDQWTAESKVARAGRPMVTVDFTTKYVKQSLAGMVENPPGVKISANKESGGEKVKRLRQAVRYFENNSNSKVQYTTFKESMEVCGIGFMEVSFDVDENNEIPAVITVEAIPDPMSVLPDPTFTKIDGSDWNFCIRIHGEEDGDQKFTYWFKDSNGYVFWAVIHKSQVVEVNYWPGSSIPIVMGLNLFYIIKAQKYIFGMIRGLKDNQRSANYFLSQAIENVALTPRPPIEAEEGSIGAEYLSDWASSANEPIPILFYRTRDESGNPVQKPMRANSTPDISWLPMMWREFINNARENTGMYEEAFGSVNGAMSGTALNKLTNAADRSQLLADQHFQASLQRVGWLMLELMEPVITPGGILPVLDDDDNVTQVAIGEYEEIMDLDSSDLDITVTAGTAYSTRKQEGLENLKEVVGLLPPEDQRKLVPQIIRDMDFPGSDVYANILDPQDGEFNPVLAMSQIQDLQGQLQQAVAENQALSSQNLELQMNLNKNTMAILEKARMDNDTKVMIEEMRQQMETFREQIKINANLEEQQISEENANLRKAADISAKAKSENKKIVMDAQKNLQQATDVIIGENTGTF